ncbi:MAG: hypothetical protein DKM22_06195 [Candidatus Melainabacteria bacterium]|nr:MAG: hypothetical protein DKM22_06195 [Candidatus Melainabacteria bacterium]
MKYWSIFFVYLVFVSFYFVSYAKNCNDEPVVTGAACSIKDLKEYSNNKDEKLQPRKNEVLFEKNKVLEKAIEKQKNK